MFLAERKACNSKELIGFKPMPGTKAQVYDGVLSYTTDTNEKIEATCFYVVHENLDLEVDMYVCVYGPKSETVKCELSGKLYCYGDNSFVTFRCKDIKTGETTKIKYSSTCTLEGRTRFANSIINNLDGRRITYER